MRKRYCIAWLVLCSCCCSMAFAQTISGEVYDKSMQVPIAGATIIASKTKHGTTTSLDGKFTIELKGDKYIEISYAGYKEQRITVTPGGKYRIELEASALDQVVIVGYGTQKKANLTGAVATVDVDKTMGSRPVTDLSRGLQGAVAGLTITTPSGDLGTNPIIRLRGLTGSLNAPNGAQPLILVDNVELPDLRMLNFSDIETVSFLKDAASASIYGSRAAWGVMLITTKSGKKGAANRITYNNNFSISKPTTTPVIADAADGAEMALQALRRTNPNVSVFGVVGISFDEVGIQKMRDWQENYGGQDLGPEMVMGRDFEIRNSRLFFYRPWDAGDMYLKEWTPQQMHNLTFSGGNAKTGYNLNLGYLNQEGVLKVNPDKFDRFNINLGVNSSVTDWLDARTKIMLSKGLKTRPHYFSSETYDPWYALYRWPKTYPYGTYEGKPFRNVITEVEQAKMSEFENTMARASVGGTFKIVKGLTLDADYTYTEFNDHTHETGGKVTAYNFWGGGGQMIYEPYTAATYDRAIYQSFWNKRSTVKSWLTYSTKISDHDIKAMTGTDIESLRYWSQTSERRGLLDPDFGEPALATGDQFARNTRGHWATLGYFGRINYAYKGKFLLELNGRFDGSSAFPKNDKWAFFPSMSAGYIISQEKFMSFSERLISYLKIRGSWGSVGNQGISGNSPFLSTMSPSVSNWIVNGVNMQQMSTPGLVSPTLTWETVTTLDFGIDTRLFNNELGITFDWYKRTTSDMLSPGVTLPNTLGTNAPRRNYGEMRTTGYELTIDWSHKFSNGINFGVTALFSDFKEEITRYANVSKILTTNFENKVLGDIWGYETERFFTRDDFEQDINGNLIIANGKYVMKPGVPTQERWEASWFFYGPGDVKYRDLNGDGKVDFGANSLDDHGDMRVIGNSTPRYQYGLRLNAEYQGFDVSVFIQGVGKRQLWPNGPLVIPGYRPGEAWYEHQLDYWTPDNQDAFYPRPTDAGQANNTRNFLPQTKYLLNMAYTRLKNITVGYNLPAKWISKARMHNARIYFSGENVAEIDHLKVPIDPEVDYTTAGLNDPNTFGRVYPYRRTYSLGLQVSF